MTLARLVNRLPRCSSVPVTRRVGSLFKNTVGASTPNKRHAPARTTAFNSVARAPSHKMSGVCLQTPSVSELLAHDMRRYMKQLSTLSPGLRHQIGQTFAFKRRRRQYYQLTTCASLGNNFLRCLPGPGTKSVRRFPTNAVGVSTTNSRHAQVRATAYHAPALAPSHEGSGACSQTLWRQQTYLPTQGGPGNTLPSLSPWSHNNKGREPGTGETRPPIQALGLNMETARSAPWQNNGRATRQMEATHGIHAPMKSQ